MCWSKSVMADMGTKCQHSFTFLKSNQHEYHKEQTPMIWELFKDR